MLSSGGTTEATEYKLFEFTDGATAINNQEEMTTDTFGIHSPIEIDVDGQKIIFPELPSPTREGKLPDLIILNPVKPGSSTFTSNTLPTRKINKVSASDADTNVTDLFGGPMKLSKSASEINKEGKVHGSQASVLSPEKQVVSRESTVYDVPRTFKPTKASDEKESGEKMNAPSTSPEYVMMEPRSKQPALTAAVNDQPDASQQLPKKKSVSDRLAPKPSPPIDPGAAAESIYDNARLIKPVVTSEQPVSVQVDKDEACSLYDVPKKLSESPSRVSKESGSVVASVVTPKTESKEKMETLYDIPKTLAPQSKQISTSPENGGTESVYDHPKKNNVVKGQVGSSDSSKETTPGPSVPSKSSTKQENDSATGKVESIYDQPRKLTQDSGADKKGSSKEPDGTSPITKPSISPKPSGADKKGSSKAADATSPITKPSISPKPSGADKKGSSKAADATSAITKPSISPKPKTESENDTEASVGSQADKSSPSKDGKTEKGSGKPLLLPKPNSAKPSVVDRPLLLPKPGTAQRVGVSPKPAAKEEDETSNPIDDTKQTSNKAAKEAVSDKEPSDSPEPCEDSPQHDSDSSSSSPAPKPRPRSKKRQQVGMPKNLMQELFAKQNSRTKLTEEKSPPPAKPPVKPKPKM